LKKEENEEDNQPYSQPKSKDFFKSVENNDVIAVLNFLFENKDLINDIDSSRKTALHIACRHDYANMIEILVDFNSSLHQKDD